MEHIAVTLRELEILVQLIDELRTATSVVKGIEKLLSSLTGLMSFEHCLLLHERQTATGAITYRREYSVRYGAPATEVHAGIDMTSVDPYLEHVVKTSRLERAFMWTSKETTSCATPTVGAMFPERLASRRGIGGLISIGDQNEKSVTLLLLQHPAEVFNDKHLAVVNAIMRSTHDSLRNSGEFSEEPSVFANLTAQEAKVMRWVVEGKTSWEVGMILSISERTVKFHLANIYTKLNVANRVQAVSLFSRVNNSRSSEAVDGMLI
jgi:LuxR family quorum-sensing system transcriptional regulator SolR